MEWIPVTSTGMTNEGVYLVNRSMLHIHPAILAMERAVPNGNRFFGCGIITIFAPSRYLWWLPLTLTSLKPSLCSFLIILREFVSITPRTYYAYKYTKVVRTSRDDAHNSAYYDVVFIQFDKTYKQPLLNNRLCRLIRPVPAPRRSLQRSFSTRLFRTSHG